MKKLCIHLSDEDHARIKAKAALAGLSLLEVGRQLFLSWERDNISLTVDVGSSNSGSEQLPSFRIANDRCPVCDEPPVFSCKCPNQDSGCKNGHRWHWDLQTQTQVEGWTHEKKTNIPISHSC